MFPTDIRILVIDDFKTMRSIVKKTLQNMGYSQIDEAEDGAQGYQKMNDSFTEGKPFGLVVCDWNMPNMSGLELLRKVRSETNYKTVPFVLVTAENEQKQVIEAAKAGVSNYIVKPFTPSDFQTKLKMVYAKHFPVKAA
jgi:two-component system chemotaxis response regulator CheY